MYTTEKTLKDVAITVMTAFIIFMTVAFIREFLNERYQKPITYNEYHNQKQGGSNE